MNAGPGRVSITPPPSYASGQTYPITVRVEDPNQRRWGFQLRASTQSAQQAGTLSRRDGTTQVLSFAGIQYIEHTNAPITGVGAGFTFTFNWQAPDVSAGPVIFHAAGNAANGNFDHTGDRIYTTSATVQPQVSGPIPSVNDGGVVNNASFAPSPAPVAPGSIAAVFGSNLNDGSTVLFSGFGPDGKLLTSLGGSSVTVNDNPAPLFYSTPAQIGIQIPTELSGATSAQIRVTVGGQTSEPRAIFLDAVAPGIFTLTQDGRGAAAVLHQDGITPVTAQNPARPGEVIVLFATGLGAVNPPLETGAPSTGNTTAIPATVSIDGLPADVQFSGTAPGFVGLNQVNVRVPPSTRTANDIPLLLSIGGKQSNPVTIAVAPGGG